ncbi:unnamed protein product [Linum trigynum]|uniref:Uncharacterized protein n=1 Tax=Linum trigynum TaxID=586398 RepID=A0AAV2GDR8_9ROSI
MDIVFSKQAAAHETFSNGSSSHSSFEDDSEGGVTSAPMPSVSSQLLLKPSSKAQARSDHNHHAASRALDRDVVLRRIRDHRSLNRVRNALLALQSGVQHGETWVDPDDAFSSP